jgi:hypothetical protein
MVACSMFTTLRAMAERHEHRLDVLLTYLDRHIDIDAEVHTPTRVWVGRGALRRRAPTLG